MTVCQLIIFIKFMSMNIYFVKIGLYIFGRKYSLTIISYSLGKLSANKINSFLNK